MKKLYIGMIIAVIIGTSCINQGSGQIEKTESNNKVLTYDVKAKDEKLLESIKRTDVPANISYNITTYMGK